MAWIESHQALGHHPKTLRLAAELKCGVPAAIGYVHLLWYWGLDYAHDGAIDASMRDQVAAACYWRGRPETFWVALLQAGFIESTETGVRIHDWMDYAGRLLARRAASAERSKRMRERVANAPGDAQRTHTERAANAQRTQLQTNKQTGEGVKPSPSQTPPNPQTAADAQGPSGTASADSQPERPLPPKWKEVAPGQHRGTPNGQGEVTLLSARCPRCERSMPIAEIEEHVCVLVTGPPVQRPAARHSAPRKLADMLGRAPAEVQAELDRMAAHPPSREQIAAEFARLGQRPTEPSA